MANGIDNTAKPAAQAGIPDVPAGYQDTPELITVDSHADQVCCDGGGGPLGHPLVYYSFDALDRVTCLYCDREFVRAGH